MRPSVLPTTQQELLLKTALLPGEAALLAWRQVSETVEAGALDDASHSLLPLVYANLVRLGLRGRRIDALKKQYLLTWRDNQEISRSIAELLRAFEDTGI